MLLLTTLSIPTTATSIFDCPLQTGPGGISVRLPPSLSLNPPFPSWTSPPPGWYFKPWSMIYASNPQYTSFRNLQYDPTSLDPSNLTGQVNDLTTFQFPGNATIYTSYGIDTPHSSWPAVLDYAGTGILAGATSQYSLLAWGCDGANTPYYVSYSTATQVTHTPAGIDIMSTSDEGVEQQTIAALIEALGKLPNKEVKKLVASLTKMVQDGARRGLPRVVCDEYCKTNQDLIGILG